MAPLSTSLSVSSSSVVLDEFNMAARRIVCSGLNALYSTIYAPKQVTIYVQYELIVVNIRLLIYENENHNSNISYIFFPILASELYGRWYVWGFWQSNQLKKDEQ